ncbi:MAG: hypothetical protein ABGZ53_19085, partial [Fuerstiella sp.]
SESLPGRGKQHNLNHDAREFNKSPQPSIDQLRAENGMTVPFVPAPIYEINRHGKRTDPSPGIP